MASALDDFLASVDARFVPIVRAVDTAVLLACPAFDTAIKYRMLMYTLNDDYWQWICAISVTKKMVNLRFLYGVMLDDPRRVLRAGTSILKTLDIATLEDVDAKLIIAYVREAVVKYDEYKAWNRAQRTAKKGGSQRAGIGQRHWGISNKSLP
jgi:hypothetical protein